MKKKIKIEKKINFSKMISEVTAIALEHDLAFVDEENIKGNLVVSGKYKSMVAAQMEEDFKYQIPVEIALTDKLNTESSKIDIIDFSYDIVEASDLLCNIELLIDGEEIVLDRECDGDPVSEKEIELPKLEEKVEDAEVETDETTSDVFEEEQLLSKDEDDENILFNIDNSETYGTFIVYIVRQNETINSILEKYNTTLEEVEKYNDIKDLAIGSKLIIPLLKDEDK